MHLHSYEWVSSRVYEFLYGNRESLFQWMLGFQVKSQQTNNEFFVFQRTIEIVQMLNFIITTKVRGLIKFTNIRLKPCLGGDLIVLTACVGPVMCDVCIAGRKQYVIIISSDMSDDSDGETSQDLAPRLKLSSSSNTPLWLGHRITWSEYWLLIGRWAERGVTTLTNWSYKTFDQGIPARSYVKSSFFFMETHKAQTTWCLWCLYINDFELWFASFALHILLSHPFSLDLKSFSF